MSDELLELPEGWEWTDVKSISSVITGKTPSTSNADFWDGGIPFVTPSQIDPSGSILPPNRTLTDLGAAQARIISENSTLAVCIGTVGKIGLLDRPSVINQQLNALTPNKNIHAKFLYYWSQYFLRSWIIENASATVNAAILNKSRLENAPVILPPLNEQRRIVAKIEELRERSQKARSALSAIPNLCNKFRQSVLAAAFRGDLTADWREQNPDVETAPVLLERIRRDRRDQWEEEELKRMRISGKQSKDDTWKAKYKEPLPPKLEELTNLPEAWGWATLDQIMKKIVDGTHHTPTYIENGVPFLSVKDIRDENIYFDNCKYISPSEHEVLCQRCKPEPGDILVTKSGTIGRCAVIETNRSFSLFVSVALLKPATQEVLPEYISIAFQAWLQTINVQNDVTGSAIKNFHIIDFRKLALPIPPIAEQKEIIQQVRNLLNAGNKSKHQIQLMQDALSELDRSILAKAFRGELVEQEPNDEPASVLLDRIRAEREQQTQGKAKKPGKNGQRTIKTDPP